MNHFLVADLNTQGELMFRQDYTMATLEQIPGASELIGSFSAAIRREPDQFEIPLHARPDSLMLRWSAAAETAGIATLWKAGELISLSLLATGLHRDADLITLNAFQSHLLRELHDTGIEPAFALTDLTERPLIATINFKSPALPADQHLAALADRCFAASYFRYHHLA